MLAALVHSRGSLLQAPILSQHPEHSTATACLSYLCTCPVGIPVSLGTNTGPGTQQVLNTCLLGRYRTEQVLGPILCSCHVAVDNEEGAGASGAGGSDPEGGGSLLYPSFRRMENFSCSLIYLRAPDTQPGSGARAPSLREGW